jgi:hypothetical protein
MPPPGSHLDAEAIYALLDGRLEPRVGRAAEAHLWRCDRCRALHEDCAALMGSLRWYAADPPAPPPGYWDEFWCELRLKPRRRGRRVVPALALAASIALLMLVQPRDEPRPAGLAAADPAPVEPVEPSPRWNSEYRLFEQATVAIGSADPLSKGIVLASLAESR